MLLSNVLQNRIDEQWPPCRESGGGGYKLQLIHSTIGTTMEKDFASSLGNNLKPKGHFLRFKKNNTFVRMFIQV